MKLYHGSPFLFDRFSLNDAGEGTGLKFGYGVYLTESEASAVHYSQPREMELMPKHYLYTVEIPDLTPGNHLVSAKPVEAYFRIPAISTVRLIDSGNALLQTRIPVYQLGQESSLPVNVILK